MVQLMSSPANSPAAQARASSPHGSKSWEVIRSFAIRLLSDQQRKKLKSLLVKIAQIPVKAAGIHHYIEDQKSELERLKSKVTYLEAKQNLAQYGLPLQSTFQVEALSSSLVLSLEQGIHNSEIAFLKNYARLDRQPMREAILNFTRSRENLRALIIGGDTPQFAASLISANKAAPETWIGLEGSEPVFHQAKQQAPQIDWAMTDPVSGILAFGASPFDLVICTRKYSHLSPIEQTQFIRLAAQTLKTGGMFVLELPDLESTEMRADTYWQDPRNLRLFSRSQLEDALKGNFSLNQSIALPSQRLAKIFLKSGCA